MKVAVYHLFRGPAGQLSLGENFTYELSPAGMTESYPGLRPMSATLHLSSRPGFLPRSTGQGRVCAFP